MHAVPEIRMNLPGLCFEVGKQIIDRGVCPYSASIYSGNMPIKRKYGEIVFRELVLIFMLKAPKTIIPEM